MSIWLKDGVSTFPIKQPMVGQKDFYQTFRDYLKDLKAAPMARIFPLIGKWGVGKSRIAFELISEALGIDKGWVVRNAKGELEPVRLLEPEFKDGILPVYIRYSQMSHDLLLGDNWVGYGVYVALCWLADDNPVKSIQGRIVESIHDALRPMGFDPAELAKAVQKDVVEYDRLLANPKDLDNLVQQGMAYLNQFGIEHLMVIVDEVESETELTRDGLREEDSEELRKKLDGTAIKVITSAIKHEDSRSRYPDVSYLPLCSPAIGDQIKELEALDRRGEMLEIHNNAYADISDYLEDLQGKRLVPAYPAGLVEAAYTIAGGNFGWFNVLMAYCDQYLLENPGADAGEILEDRMASITRIKEKLIDGSQFDYISIGEADARMPTIRRALLQQLPQPKRDFDAETLRTLMEAQQLDGTPLFRDFYAAKLEKNRLGGLLEQSGYKLGNDNEFINQSTGEKFNLDVLLRSLATYSIRAVQEHYVIGKDRDIFLEQVRMLYPKEAVEDAAFILYDFISGLARPGESEDFIGPNFSFLEKLNRRYAVQKGLTNYLLSNEADQKLKEHLKELKNDHAGEVKRILKGCARVLELDYPFEEYFTVQGAQGLRTKVHSHLFLGAHRDGKVDLVWGQVNNLKDVLTDNKLMEIGAHPIIVLSLSAATEEELKIIKEQYKAVGHWIIFFHLTSLQRDLLEVISIEKEYMDIRQTAHQLAPQFQNRLRSIRDEISRRAKEWFQEVDRCGFVLRPIVFSKTVEENIPVLAEGFARMLRFEATAQELGAKEGVKFEPEDYNRFSHALPSTQVGAKLISEGYQDAGLFVKEQDGYRAVVPATAAYFLQYLGNSWKTTDNVLNHFFFSAVDVIKPKKIVDQWSAFLQASGLILATEDETRLISVTRHDLEAKLDKVENWLDSDFDTLLKGFSGIITKGKIDDMFIFKAKYEGYLNQVKTLFANIDLEAMKNRASRNEVWKEQLEQLNRFHKLCEYIYDEEKWHKTQFNERELEKIKLDNNDLPVWFRLRHIQLFHEFITEIQDQVSKKIEERIEEIKKSSNYKGYDMPISPVTNALKRYNTEITYAKDNKKTTELPTMVSKPETLAFKLFEADYRQALDRLWKILDEVGLCKDDYSWKEDAGMVGIYTRSKGHFEKLVNGYLENQGEVNRWLQYFQGAPANVMPPDKIDKLKNTLSGIDIFLTGGLMQEIDDGELEFQDEPQRFAKLLEEVLAQHSEEITVLLTYLTEVKVVAREYRNGLYDENLKDAVNCIRRVIGGAPEELELTKLPGEAAYRETVKKVAEQMKKLDKEGREFFAAREAKHVTFDFFQEVVKKKANLDWHTHAEERRELESMGLIQTKVVLC